MLLQKIKSIISFRYIKRNTFTYINGNKVYIYLQNKRYNVDHFYHHGRKYLILMHFIFGSHCDFSHSLPNYYSLASFSCRVHDIAITLH